MLRVERCGSGAAGGGCCIGQDARFSRIGYGGRRGRKRSRGSGGWFCRLSVSGTLTRSNYQTYKGYAEKFMHAKKIDQLGAENTPKAQQPVRSGGKKHMKRHAAQVLITLQRCTLTGGISKEAVTIGKGLVFAKIYGSSHCLNAKRQV